MPSEKICIVGSGKLFRAREPLVRAFESLGKRVEVSATSVEYASATVPTLKTVSIAGFFESAVLSIVMLSAYAASSPSAANLEHQALIYLQETGKVFGIAADEIGVLNEQDKRVMHTKTQIRFILMQKHFFGPLRGVGYPMQFFSPEDPPGDVARTMLQYTNMVV